MDPEKALQGLKDTLRFQPTGILDVGANVGGWTAAVREVFPQAAFFMVEGNEMHREVLTASGVPFEIAVLANESRTVTWHEHPKKHTGSSLYAENTHTFNDAEARVRMLVQCRVLCRPIMQGLWSLRRL